MGTLEELRYYEKSEIKQGAFLTVHLEGRNRRIAIVRADDLEYNNNDEFRFAGLMISNMDSDSPNEWKYQKCGGIWFHERPTRPSNVDEIAWLLACEEKNCSVPRGEVTIRTELLLKIWEH